MNAEATVDSRRAGHKRRHNNFITSCPALNIVGSVMNKNCIQTKPAIGHSTAKEVKVGLDQSRLDEKRAVARSGEPGETSPIEWFTRLLIQACQPQLTSPFHVKQCFEANQHFRSIPTLWPARTREVYLKPGPSIASAPSTKIPLSNNDSTSCSTAF
jgi:hypothetical protein